MAATEHEFPAMRRIILAACLICAAQLAKADDDSLRCGNRLAAIGMVAAEVAAICGAPDYQEHRGDPGLSPLFGVVEDIWYYNRGPSELVRQLRFRNDKLWKIRSDGYGFDPPPADGSSCTPDQIFVGESKFRLISWCNDPVSRRAESLWVPLAQLGYVEPFPVMRGGAVFVYRERWTYNFGASRLQREITIDNDRVTEVKLGGSGFD